MFQDSFKQSYEAGEALAADRLVKLSAAGTNRPRVVYADEGDVALGVTMNTAAAVGDHVSVRALMHTFEMVASGVIAFGAKVIPDTDGKVQESTSNDGFFVALKAASADGDVIEVGFVPSLDADRDSVTIANGSGDTYAEGSLQQVGMLGLGYIPADIEDAASGLALLKGRFTLAALSTDEWTPGTRLYWDAGNSRLTDTPAAHFFAGFATGTKINGVATASVQLAPFTDDAPRIWTAAATGNQTVADALMISGKPAIIYVPNTAALTITLPTETDIPIGATARIDKSSADAEIVTVEGSTSIDAAGDWQLYVNDGSTYDKLDELIA